MALDKITAEAIAPGAVTITAMPDGVVTAAKLHTTAITDKLGFTPVSPTQLTNTITSVVGSAPAALDTLNEIAAALGNDSNYAATITNALSAKANTSSLAAVATSGSYNDLTDKPTAGTLAAVATSGSYYDLINTPNLAWVATSGSYIDLVDRPSLATVATTGSYNDLTNQPYIPSLAGYASQTYVDIQVANLVATALGNDSNFATTISNALSTKANASSFTNVENKSSATIRSEITSSNVTSALGYTPVSSSGGTITGEIGVSRLNVNSNTAAWCPTSYFPITVKGVGDGGFRTIAAAGNAAGSSSWFGSTTTPQLAIDTENNSAAFWLNNGTTTIGSWMKMIDFSYNGTTNFYGGNGGAAITVRNGGDLEIKNAANDYTATMWTDGTPSGSGSGNGGMMWFASLCLRNQRTTYDRSWDNYPSITVLNHTDQGPQGEFRVHGANGVSGGDFSCALRADGGFISGSDARRKTNIEPITNALQTVTALNGKKFNITNRAGELDPIRGNKKQYGLIAQECKDVIDEAVTFYPEADTPNENGWASAYSIDYQSLTALLVEAIKEQQEIITQLSNRVQALENK